MSKTPCKAQQPPAIAQASAAAWPARRPQLSPAPAPQRPPPLEVSMHGKFEGTPYPYFLAPPAIYFEGGRYQYNGYHYDRLSDAVAYAQLMQSRALKDNEPGPFLCSRPVRAPTGEDRRLMASLAIRFEAGRYRFESFRYDRLADAADYATLALRRR